MFVLKMRIKIISLQDSSFILVLIVSKVPDL